MDYDEYVNLAHQGAALDEAGEYEQALGIFRYLVASDISDLDKAMMCQNCGTIQEKMGQEEQALASYEQGMNYERAHGRIGLAEGRAGYLYRLGRMTESLRAYEEIMRRASLMEADKLRIEHNITALREQIAAGK